MKIPRIDSKSLVLILMLAGSVWWIAADLQRGFKARRAERLQSEIQSGVNAYHGTNQPLSETDQAILNSIAAEQSR